MSTFNEYLRVFEQADNSTKFCKKYNIGGLHDHEKQTKIEALKCLQQKPLFLLCDDDIVAAHQLVEYQTNLLLEVNDDDPWPRTMPTFEIMCFGEDKERLQGAAAARQLEFKTTILVRHYPNDSSDSG